MELSHSGGWAHKATEDGYGRSWEIFPAGKSRSCSIWIKSFTSLLHETSWDWHLAPDSARPDMFQQECCISAGSPAAHPSGCLGKKDPMTYHDTWHIMTHQPTHGHSILIRSLLTLFQIATSVKMVINTPLTSVTYSSSSWFFFFREVIVFHRSQQGFWEIQILLFCRGKIILLVTMKWNRTNVISFHQLSPDLDQCFLIPNLGQSCNYIFFFLAPLNL